jgi:hypothetical protein
MASAESTGLSDGAIATPLGADVRDDLCEMGAACALGALTELGADPADEAPFGPPGGSAGNLIVGAADGFGGKLMRTVSFLG